MALPISKLAPKAVVIAAVTCCTWPYVFSSNSGGTPPAALPEIASSQLSPRILSPPTRNPFQPASRPVAAAAKPASTATAKTAGGKGPAVAAQGKPVPDPGHQPLGTSVVSMVDGLALSATSILADERLAVINGRIYMERDRLRGKDPSAPPCIVARILPDRVLLECAGRTATLGYANLTAHSKGPKK